MIRYIRYNVKQEGKVLERMNEIVAGNIRRLREERGLTMEELARLSGVSRSMVAQVERGEGNPTLSTLWKLSNGMKVPFHALTMSPKAPYEVVRPADLQPILEDGGRVKNYSIFPDDEDRRFSVYYMELEPGSSWRSEPHLRGTAEFVTVFSGGLEIATAERTLTVGPGESVRFPGDVVHSYRSLGEEKTMLHMILYNP